MFSVKERIRKLEEVADGPCTCTDEMKEPFSDKPMCASCKANTFLNEILCEILQRGHPGTVLMKPYGAKTPTGVNGAIG